MVTANDLKSILIFQDLEPEQLELIVPLTEEVEYKEKDVIYRKGQPAQNLYCLLEGKAVLEDDISPLVSISLSALKPGYVFGWYSLLPSGTYSYNPVCTEPCRVLIIPRDKLLKVLDDNPDMGYLIMRRIFEILKLRLDHRTSQFLSLLSMHPDLRELVQADSLTPDRQEDEDA